MLQELNSALVARDWETVSSTLDRAGALDLAGERLLRYSRNMAALSTRLPDLASAVDLAPDTGRFQIGRLGQSETVVDLSAGAPRPLAIPEESVAQFRTQLDPADVNCPGVAVLGIGDGQLLNVLGEEPAQSLGLVRPVWVIEPELELLRAVMMIRDLRAVLGSGRFKVLAGPNWRDELLAEAERDPWTPVPTVFARHTTAGNELAAGIAALAERRQRRFEESKARVASLYAGRTPRDAARRLAEGNARVVLLTSRFTTVLQHSTRDFAAGFASMGCTTSLLIEPDDWCRHSLLTMSERIADFEPDLIVQVDHHRAENAGVFPEAVPFLCLIQDNLDSLTGSAAPAAMGNTDFAAGPWADRYVREFGYPADRTFVIPRLSNAKRPAGSIDRGAHADLLYVSNHSQTHDQIRASFEDALSTTENGRRLGHAVLDALFEFYERGERLEHAGAVRRFVLRTAASLGVRGKGDSMERLIELIATRANNPLYRQQGLAWAAEAADELGLRLAVHGSGWGQNPRFARFARGPIGYGEELERATACSRVSLFLEPYFPTSHQRSLDAWLSGGLPLLRQRETDITQEAFGEWIEKLAPAASVEEARAALSGGDLDAFDRLLEAQAAVDSGSSEDLVAAARRRIDDGIGWMMRMPPESQAVSFADVASLRERVSWLMSHEDEAERIRATQEAWVADRFGYAGGAKQIASRIATHFS